MSLNTAMKMCKNVTINRLIIGIKIVITNNLKVNKGQCQGFILDHMLVLVYHTLSTSFSSNAGHFLVLILLMVMSA